MISIVIPVYNEEEVLEKNLEKLKSYLSQKANRPFEILVVDNGSVDKTAEICQRVQANSGGWFRYFKIPERSVGKAFAKGVREAKYDFIISQDADLSTNLDFIDEAEHLLQISSMVVGSKTLGNQKRSLTRVIGSQVYLAITQMLFRMTLTDFSMGAKAYRKKDILHILDDIDFWTAYVFEIAVYLTAHHRKILQVGVNCVDQRVSRFNIWHEGFYRYSNLFKVWRRLKNPKSWYHKPLISA